MTKEEKIRLIVKELNDIERNSLDTDQRISDLLIDLFEMRAWNVATDWMRTHPINEAFG